MTTAELRAKLSVIEPTEATYAGIESSDVPALEQLISQGEEWLAARAVFALSRVGGSNAVTVLEKAATDQRSSVRVAVAAATSQRPIVLPDAAVLRLLQDKDVGVRKFATYAVKRENGAAAHQLLNRLALEDPVPTVRAKAVEALRKVR